MREEIRAAVHKSLDNLGLDIAHMDCRIEIDIPKKREFGDFSTNIALILAKSVGKNPREVAELIGDGQPPGIHVRSLSNSMIVDKPYLYLPLHKIPATGVLRGTAFAAATGPVVGESAGGPGTGAPRDIYWIGIPLVLDPYQNFSLRLQFDGSPPTNMTWDIQVFMEGYLRRPGQ